MSKVVIGAGATGLVTAYLLARAGHRVTVLEASPTAGGLLSTFDVAPRAPLEYFYHHFFTHDAEIHWLLRELGLEQDIVYRRSTMAMYRSGQMHGFDGARDLLRFSAMSLAARIRFGLASAWLANDRRWTQRHDTPCLAWLHRFMGREATETIWKPMLAIKFGEAAEQVPLAWLAGRLRQRVLSRKRGVERLGYLTGSLQSLVDRLLQRLTASGVDVRLATPTTGLVVSGGVVRGVITPGGQVPADTVLSTVPTPALARLVAPVHPSYADRLARLPYTAAICTVLALREPLSSTYWTNVADDGFDFGGIIEHTNLVPASHYGNQSVVYLSRYVDREHPLYAMPDDQLLARQLEQLARIYRRDVRPLLTRHWVFRAPHAAPLVTLGYPRLIPSFRSPIDGLFVGSMCHLYPDERSVNNSIRIAAELLRAAGWSTLADEVPRGLSEAGILGHAPSVMEECLVARAA